MLADVQNRRAFADQLVVCESVRQRASNRGQAGVQLGRRKCQCARFDLIGRLRLGGGDNNKHADATFRVAQGQEAEYIKRSIREAIQIAVITDEAVISDEEIDDKLGD